MSHRHAIKPSANPDRRQGERRAIRFVAEIADGPGRALSVRVLNISRGGFMAECEGGLKLRSVISFAAPNGETFPAKVRWVKDGRIGCEFVNPLEWEDVLGLGLEELDSGELPPAAAASKRG